MVVPIGVLLQQLADFGFFFYILPFMLIFALVFAILYKLNLLGGADRNDARGVNAVIALSVALLSLQFDAVPIFFQAIFPKLGIALSILLVFMILGGLFVDFSKPGGPSVIFFTIAAVLSIIVLLTSFSDYSWWTGSWWQSNISAIVAGVIILIFVFIIVGSGKTTPGVAPFPARYYGPPNIGT